MQGCLGLAPGSGYQWLGAEADKLDRALVAGLMLDAALAAPLPPPDPRAWGRVLKIRVQEELLTHLAGRITLDRFHTLVTILNYCFPFYLPLISPLLRPREERAAADAAGEVDKYSLPVSASRAIRGDLLAAALDRLQGVLPRRPRCKLRKDKLTAFLNRTCGCRFRLRDFQEYFSMDRKTAWEYVRKFLDSGLLGHNRGRAAAVRYALADEFLQVRGEAVRKHAAAALEDLPSHLAPQVADLLIASGGEPFWEEEWRGLLPTAHFQEILRRFTASASLLEVVSAPDRGSRLLRLQSGWLNS